MSLKRNKTYRFSLTELMIVVAIMAILISLLQPSLRKMIAGSHQLECSNNLRIHGVAIDMYAEEFENMVCMTFWPGTATMGTVYHPAVFRNGRLRANKQGNFHDGSLGYLEPYIGNDARSYHCPSAYYPQGLDKFSIAGRFVKRVSTYSGFTGFNNMVKSGQTIRTRDNFYMINPRTDERQKWDQQTLKVYLMDSVVNLGAWVRPGEMWDLSGSIIHENNGPLPILMSDGHVLHLERSRIESNPSFINIINAVYDSI